MSAKDAGPGVVGIVAPALLALALTACGSTAGSTPAGEASDGTSGARPGELAAPDTALERMAGELRPAVERAAGLRFRRPPRLARSSREKLEAFLTERLAAELPPERAEAVTAAYARFGLLPDTLRLRPLLRSLLLEQVAGYYDPQADTLFVREGASPETLRPILVHELVHALQDQHMDLDSVMAARAGDNDAATAAQAAVEGHATFAMVEWQMGRATGRDVDLTQMPDLGAMLAGQDLGALSGMPRLSGAPPLIRESLLFPYTGGLTFVQRLWRAAGGRPVPIGADLPASTEQILHPGRYLATPRDAPTGLGLADPGSGWSAVHADGLGEFETRFLLTSFTGDSTEARRAAEGWDGDRYRLLRGDGTGEALVWTTVWDTRRDAAEFEEAVRGAYRARYGSEGAGAGSGPLVVGGREVTVERLTAEGRAVVQVVDRPAGLSLPHRLLAFELTGG